MIFKKKIYIILMTVAVITATIVIIPEVVLSNFSIQSITKILRIDLLFGSGRTATKINPARRTFVVTPNEIKYPAYTTNSKIATGYNYLRKSVSHIQSDHESSTFSGKASTYSYQTENPAVKNNIHSSNEIAYAAVSDYRTNYSYKKDKNNTDESTQRINIPNHLFAATSSVRLGSVVSTSAFQTTNIDEALAAADAPQKASYDFGPDPDPVPIGNELFILSLLAIAYLGFKQKQQIKNYIKRKRQIK